MIMTPYWTSLSVPENEVKFVDRVGNGFAAKDSCGNSVAVSSGTEMVSSRLLLNLIMAHIEDCC